VVLPAGQLRQFDDRRSLGAAKATAKPLAGALVEGYSLRAWPPAKPAELPENSPMGITGRLEDKRTDALTRLRTRRLSAPGSGYLALSETLNWATERAKPRKKHRHNHRSELRTGVSQRLTGGEGGIRTLGTCKGTTVFETAAFNRSATSPVSRA
jgi:hypothetical protein